MMRAVTSSGPAREGRSRLRLSTGSFKRGKIKDEPSTGFCILPFGFATKCASQIDDQLHAETS